MAAWGAQIKELIDLTIQGARAWEATSMDIIEQAMKEAQRLASERTEPLDDDSRLESPTPTESPEQTDKLALPNTQIPKEGQHFEQATTIELDVETVRYSNLQPNSADPDHSDTSLTTNPTLPISDPAIGDVCSDEALEPDVKMLSLPLDRAISLRWVLRDLVSERKTWSQVDRMDLQTLVKIGLVKNNEDVPTVTDAGHTAIGT